MEALAPPPRVARERDEFLRAQDEITSLFAGTSRNYFSGKSSRVDAAVNQHREILSPGKATIILVPVGQRLMTSMRTHAADVRHEPRAGLLGSLQMLVGACLLGAVASGVFFSWAGHPDIVRMSGALLAATVYFVTRDRRQ